MIRNARIDLMFRLIRVINTSVDIKRKDKIMTNSFLVNFGARIFVVGDIQVNANSQAEAEELAEALLQESLNEEYCIVEIENGVTIKSMEVSGTFSGIDITDSMQLD